MADDRAVDEEITVLCAWCGITLREGGATISHGICHGCAPTLLEKIRERLGKSADGPSSSPRAVAETREGTEGA